MKHHSGRVRLGAGLSAATLLLGISACGDSATGASGEGSDGAYSIGWVGDQSGPLTALTESYLAGARLYFDQVNSDGGIDGHDITLTALDDGSDPVKGVAAVKQLIDGRDVSALMVPTSSTVQAAADIVKAEQVPMLAPAVSTELLHPVRPMIFETDAHVADQATAIAHYLEANPTGTGPERVGIIAVDSAAVASYVANAEKQIADRGWVTVGAQKVALTSSSAATQATAIAAKNPTAVILGLIDSFAISAVETLRAQGYTGPIFNYAFGSTPPTMKKLADPNYFPVRSYPYTFGSDAAPMVVEYAKAAEAKGIDPDGPETLLGYVNAYVLTLALEDCGYPCDGTSLAKSLEGLGTVDTQGMTTGEWKFSPDSHNGIVSVQLFAWDPETSAPERASDSLPLT